MTEATVDTTPVAPVIPVVPPVVLPSDEPTEKLLAGKYKTQEELEKGYVELQKAFSARKPAEEPAVVPPVVVTPEGDIVAKAGLDMDVLTKEYSETGNLSEASLKALEGIGVTKSIVDTYFRGQEALAANEVAQTQAIVGGKEAYDAILAWASTNLDETEIKVYNDAMLGDLPTRKFAVEAMKAKYHGKVGSDPKIIVGSGASQSSTGYESVAQMTRDMKDARYAKDPAFRKAVADKIARSTAI